MSDILRFLSPSNRLYNAHLVHPQVFRQEQRLLTSDFKDVSPLRVVISFSLQKTALNLITSLDKQREDLTTGPWSVVMLQSLLEAIETGQAEIVEALLKAQVSPFQSEPLPATVLDRTFVYTDERPRTALEKSLSYGNSETTRMLLEWNRGRAIPDSIVPHAVAAQSQGVLLMFLNQSQDKQIRHLRLERIFHLACTLGKLSIIDFALISGNLSIDCRNEEEHTALATAVNLGHSQVVQHLIKLGAKSSDNVVIVQMEDDESKFRSLLQGASASQDVYKRRLHLVCDDILPLGYASANILIDDAMSTFETHVKRLLTLEPNPLELLSNPDFMLSLRDDSEYVKIINILLEHKADICIRGEAGETVLHLAVISKARTEQLLIHLRHLQVEDINVNSRD